MKPATAKYSSGHKSFVLWLFGVIICIQVVYQFMLNSALNKREELTWDEICEVSPSNSPHCMEVNIFRSWQDAAMQMRPGDDVVDTEEDLEKLVRDIGDHSNHEASVVVPLQMATTSAPTYVPYLEVATEAPQELVSIPSSHIAIEVADVSSSRWGKMLEAPDEEPETTAYSVLEKIETPTNSTDSAQLSFQQVDEQALKYFNISNETEWNRLTPWAKDLVALQGRLEAHMTEVRKRREHRRSVGNLGNTSHHAYSSYAEKTTALTGHHGWSNLTDWSRSLIDLQNNLTERMNNLRSKRRERESARAIKAKSNSLQESINEYMQEMCMEPFRRNYPACIKFFAVENGTNGTGAADMQIKQRHDENNHLFSKYSLGDSMQSFDINEFGEVQTTSDEQHLQGMNSSISKHIDYSNKTRTMLAQQVDDIVVQHRNLCAEMRAYGFRFCNDIFNESSNWNVSTDTTNRPSSVRASLRAHSRSRFPHISWSKVLGWKSSSFWKSPSPQGIAVATPSELRYVHWEGTHPSVACISVVPSGTQIRTWLKYFVSNFQLQSYEGKRQLILVYDYKNEDIGNFLRAYADGEQIKAVPAFEDGELPSTTAFRFGMWTASDADVYARWDFNKWHSTHRLKMQVRSMAYTGRPASVLGSASQLGIASNADGNTQHDDIDWKASLVGEASWMRTNWYPLLESEHDVILGALASGVVHVEPEEDTSLHTGASSDNQESWSEVKASIIG